MEEQRQLTVAKTQRKVQLLKAQFVEHKNKWEAVSAFDVVVVVLEQVGRGESVAVVVVVVVLLKAQFVEHENKWETVSALM